ncbi:MAG: hypothetical protein ABI854_07215 [Betaproteobacteria bacterium]
MYVRLVLTHLRGVPRPKSHIVRAEGLTGELVTLYELDPYMRRTILVATFRSDVLMDSALPMRLLDARCVSISEGGILLSGFDREAADRGGQAEHAQGWWLRPERLVKHRDLKTPDSRNAPPGMCEGHREPSGSWTRRLKKP